MRRSIFFIGLLLFILAFGLAVFFNKKLPAIPAPPLQDYGAIKDFTLTDHTGAPFDSTNLRGKVWLANFFFSSCKGVCPAINGKVKFVAKKYAAQLDTIAFVSITVDPVVDTAEHLAEYRKPLAGEDKRWLFLTGSLEQINQVSHQTFRFPEIEDPNAHSARIVLIDKRGHVRGFFLSYDEEQFMALQKAISRLLSE